ncbi:MAG: DAK2 domain-containing protein [Oscillospiraceae bacterium]|jgi:DAK2 domain fusion protein YloV|nr:DAK2 domain-containing protein [Oscillospiraceae bacterium]
MLINASAAINNHQTEVNELNVFPVPDGDTGINMSLTMAYAVNKLSEEEPKTVARAAEISANALNRGSRGNSGVILSLLFRGIAKKFKDLEAANAKQFAEAMAEGVQAAYNAVMKPTEGTILTVSRLAADAAVAAAETETDIETVLEHALAEGEIALADTINLNPVLKKAGVIDSGGKGYIYILDGMLRALRGETIIAVADDSAANPSRDAADFSDFDTGDITFTYCTEFIVQRENDKNPELFRTFLDKLGDSLVLVDDDEIIKVHVHTNDPGVAISEALTYGSMLTVKIENMREQHTTKLVEHDAKAGNGSPAAPEKRYGAVAVCSGEGLEEVFRDLGADRLITGGQTMNPSTEDILSAVEATPAEVVFVYPNNKNIIMAAEQAVPLSSKHIVVVPTKSIPQGVAAMLAFDADSEPGHNLEAASTAAANVRTVLITHAARDSTFDGYDIHEGEFLALFNDSLLASSADFGAIADAITEKLTERLPEFVTVFAGEGSDNAEADALAAKLGTLSGVEITAIDGGQPVYRYVISAE